MCGPPCNGCVHMMYCNNSDWGCSSEITDQSSETKDYGYSYINYNSSSVRLEPKQTSVFSKFSWFVYVLGFSFVSLFVGFLIMSNYYLIKVLFVNLLIGIAIALILSIGVIVFLYILFFVVLYLLHVFIVFYALSKCINYEK